MEVISDVIDVGKTKEMIFLKKYSFFMRSVEMGE